MGLFFVRKSKYLDIVMRWDAAMRSILEVEGERDTAIRRAEDAEATASRLKSALNRIEMQAREEAAGKADDDKQIIVKPSMAYKHCCRKPASAVNATGASV